MGAMQQKVISALFVMLVLWVMPETSNGQSFVAHSGHYTTPISMRQVVEMVNLLGFNDEQAGHAKSLYTGYRREYRDLVVRCDRAIKDAYAKEEEARDWSGVRSVYSESLGTYLKGADTLEKTLLADIRGLCNEEQASRWTSAERYRRRASELRYGVVAGEAVDLIRILDRMGVDRSRDDVAEIVSQYEAQMDPLLLEKIRLHQDINKKVLELRIRAVEEELKELQRAVYRNWVRIGLSIRDVNWSASRRVAAVLHPDVAEKLNEEVLRASYPNIYGDDRMDKHIAAAVSLTGITEEQNRELNFLRESYRASVRPILEQLAKEVDHQQQELMRDAFAHFERLKSEPGKESSLLLLFRSRDRLDADYRERILRVVTQARADELPEFGTLGFREVPEHPAPSQLESDWKNWESEGD